jgi:hypothetical protein
VRDVWSVLLLSRQPSYTIVLLRAMSGARKLTLGAARKARRESCMGDAEDDERTRKARLRNGRRGNGKATLSPVKQREKAAKAYVHVFKHNIKALKILQREREMLEEETSQ